MSTLKLEVCLLAGDFQLANQDLLVAKCDGSVWGWDRETRTYGYAYFFPSPSNKSAFRELECRKHHRAEIGHTMSLPLPSQLLDKQHMEVLHHHACTCSDVYDTYAG
jgi:hypothetical protein